MHPSLRLSHAAETDIVQILAWSHEQFGPAARERYEALIAAALNDVADRDMLGSVARPDLGEGIHTRHLRQSRARSTGATVHQPRHFVVFRVDEDAVVIVRVLHDAMDLPRHLDA